MAENNYIVELTEKMGFGIAIYSDRSVPVYCNSIFLSLVGKPEKDFWNYPLDDFLNINLHFDIIFADCKNKSSINFTPTWMMEKQMKLRLYHLPENNQMACVLEQISSERDSNDHFFIKPHVLNHLVEEAAESFIVIGKDNRIINANSSAVKLTGYSKNELIAKDFRALFSDQDNIRQSFDFSVLKEKDYLVIEKKIRCKNDTFINIEIRARQLADGNYFAAIRDITSRIVIRTQLESKNQELEQAYSQVIDSEKKYKQLFKNIPLGIFTATGDGKIESINIQMAAMLGSDSIERSKKFNLFDLPSLKGSHFIEDFKLTVSEGISHHKIYEYTSVWNKKTCLKAHMLLLETEEQPKVLVLVEDYTKEREKENRLKILSQGVDNSPASIVVTDSQGKIKFVNKSFLKITGYSMNELIDNTPALLKSGYHNEEFYKNLWNTILAGKEWVGEFRNKKKNGELFWESAMISALRDGKGRITNFMAIKEDITHKKQVEQELKEKTEQLLTLVNNTPDNICFKEADGTWILANTATLDFFGLKNVPYQGKTNEELTRLSDKDKTFLTEDSTTDSEAWNKGTLLQYETNGSDYEGNPIILEILKMPLFLSDGTRKGLINIGRDITKRKQYEKELKIAKEKAEESDMLKSSFLANMSHEIRTPLNAIMGFSGLMADYSLDKESITRFVDIIQVNGKQLLTIIDDILLISKLEVKQIKVTTAVFDLNQILNKLYQQFMRELDISKEKEIEMSVVKNTEGSVKIKTDRDKFFIIFSKLIRNAVKFTSKGKVNFGFEIDNNKEITFFVKDTGVGISPEKQKLIFHKFRQVDDSTTREYGGTGLGLSIVQGLIELLNGDLWLESQLNKGSAFYFKLPLESCEIENPVEEEKKQTIDWSGKKVLIVDDVEVSVFLLNEILKHTKIKIFTAFSGIEAIEQFKANPDIDIVLMDLQLPEMSGLEAAQQIKSINPKVAVIMQTAFGHDGYEQKSKEAGCDDIIYKPIKFDVLKTKMSRFL